MKSLTKCIFILLCLTLLSSSQLFGQEWSAEQKEVLKNMETIFELFANKDLEGGMDYFHDDFITWANVDSLPGNKASLGKNISNTMEKIKNFTYDIKPVAIKIHGNVAIVCYNESVQFNYLDGNVWNQNRRQIDIYMKERDKWVAIGNFPTVD